MRFRTLNMTFLRPIRSICITVVTTLIVVTVVLIYRGPFITILEGGTNFVQSFKKVDELEPKLEWPALVICKSGREKSPEAWGEFLNKGMSRNFSSQEEFEELANKAFYNQPEEAVFKILFGPDYLSTLQGPLEIPVREPYVTMNLVDMFYLGYCALVDIEAVRKDFMPNGTDFSIMIVIQGYERTTNYMTKFVQPGEWVDILVPTESFTIVDANTITIFSLDITRTKRINNCDEK